MSRVMVVSAPVALTGVSSMAQAPPVPLFAFASPDAAAGWQAVNDGVMGGVSDGRFRITEGQTLEFYGTLSLENNGGFASVRSRPRTLGLQTGDSLVVRVRGDGREYQFRDPVLGSVASRSRLLLPPRGRARLPARRARARMRPSSSDRALHAQDDRLVSRAGPVAHRRRAGRRRLTRAPR
jgi:hypothetical protein